MVNVRNWCWEIKRLSDGFYFGLRLLPVQKEYRHFEAQS
jgi:hypothetical protein